MSSNFKTREQWLNAAGEHLARLVKDAGYTLPKEGVRYSCGWPSKGGLAKKKRVIGQCWSADASKGEVFEIFISPTQSNPVDVLAITLHELIHAVVGIKEGHKGHFKTLAVLVGLEGKMTATVPGKELREKLAGVASRLGEYPHAELRGRENSGPPKQGTRLVKCECPKCGYIIRTTQKWLDEVGPPICPADGATFSYDGDDEDGDDERDE